MDTKRETLNILSLPIDMINIIFEQINNTCSYLSMRLSCSYIYTNVNTIRIFKNGDLIEVVNLLRANILF